jgi:hypothetical protein
LWATLRELDAEHFGGSLDADALLQFAKVDRMGHAVLLSLPEQIVREGSEPIGCYPQVGYHSTIAPRSSCKEMDATFPLTLSSVGLVAPTIYNC